MIKVCLVDDHRIMREGLKKILSDSKDIVVVDEAGNGQELFEKMDNQEWDVLVLDISLPDRSGLDLLKEIKRRQSSIPVLILSMHNEDQYGYRAFQAGASGYLTKDIVPNLLCSAIYKLAKGKKYVSPNLAEKLATYLACHKKMHSYDSISDREFEVLILIGSGKSPTEIAADLSLSIKTISTYRARILDKLNLNNNSDIIHYCIQHQLLTGCKKECDKRKVL